MMNFGKRIFHYLNLETDLDDFDKIHENIVKDIVFRGANLWILMFAVVVASVGLNMNSTAVIIGAMLISPLMGPINGMGYSIATYNFALLRQSIKNFSFAVALSLIASTIYFALSPISTAHSELLARTSPTVYDVLIAMFGGLAGIVAISSRNKGTVIPGVAIATALMPPLCTAGYGLATAQLDFFFGAMYLFSINTVFIALSSVAIAQLLKFPIRTIVEDSHKKEVTKWISLVLFLVLLPSIYFGYRLVQKEKFTVQANKYIDIVSVFEGNFLLKSTTDFKSKSITLIYGGEIMNEEQKKKIREKRSYFGLGNALINFQQGLNAEFLDRKNAEVQKLRDELNRFSQKLKMEENQLDSISKSKYAGKNILAEIKNLYPQIETCSYATSYTFNETSHDSIKTKIVVFGLNHKSLPKSDRKKINNWLMVRLKSGNIKVFFDQ